MRKLKNKEKILIGLNASLITWRLHKAFDDLGKYNAYARLHTYTFENEQENVVEGELKYVTSFRKYYKAFNEEKSKWRKKVIKFNWCLNIWAFFFYALFHFNVYILLYGNGILSFLPKTNNLIYKFEFILYKILGKKVIVWFLGSDSRAPYVNFNYDIVRNKYLYTRKKWNRIRFLDKYAIVIDNPASAHFHLKKYICFQKIGIPVDNQEVIGRRVTNDDGKIKILHAPSKIAAKGTEEIRKIINSVKEKGFNIEYIEKTGVVHSDVLEAMVDCDILLDQLYSDTPMAGLTAEAGVNAIPFITGGYFSLYSKEILGEYHAPGIYCLPKEVEEQLIKLIKDKEYREKIGREEKEFIDRYYNSIEVAKKFLILTQGNIPDEWYYDPYDSEYIWGCGCSKENVRSNVKEMVELLGLSGLFIDDKEKLLFKYKEELNIC